MKKTAEEAPAEPAPAGETAPTGEGEAPATSDEKPGDAATAETEPAAESQTPGEDRTAAPGHGADEEDRGGGPCRTRARRETAPTGEGEAPPRRAKGSPGTLPPPKPSPRPNRRPPGRTGRRQRLRRPMKKPTEEAPAELMPAGETAPTGEGEAPATSEGKPGDAAAAETEPAVRTADPRGGPHGGPGAEPMRRRTTTSAELAPGARPLRD